MRFCLTLLLFAVNPIVWGQFSDDFEDGDFTNAPSWSGETSNFIVNGANELQLLAPAVTDTSYLSLPTSNITTSWDFYVRLDFNPSSSNYARVYLVSDNANLQASLNGYYVMLGGTSDEISLYRQDGTTVTEIIDGLDGALNSDPCEARIQVTRDGAGNWELFRDTLGGTNFFSEGTVLDATYTTNSNFGLFCRYTSTRSDKFFFDDLGDPFIDGTNPTIDTVIVISDTQLDVHFSESLEQVSAETTANYSVDSGIGAPSSAIQDGVDASLIHLTFSNAFVNGTNYLLTVNNITDLALNPISSPTDVPFSYFVLGTAVTGDLRITEFVADPSPSVALPEVEYVEVYNTSSKYIDLNNWQISDGSSSGTFATYIIAPDEYLLICNTGEGGQFFVANYTELSLPSLNNAGDNIILKDDLGQTIDSITYDLSWYNDPSKEDGGWAIERKYYATECNDASNWSASLNPIGGTPAIENSVYTTNPDSNPPLISSFNLVSATQLEITFIDAMDTLVPPQFTVSPAITSIAVNQWLSINTVRLDVQSFQQGILYSIDVSAAQDCWGNVMGAQTIVLGIPDAIEAEDIVLNEVMFNPLTGGSDYVEIYNRSDKILDVSELYFANWDDSIANVKAITNDQRLILPQEYILVTEDTNDIINDFAIYGLGTFIETDLPTYPNDSGTVYLLKSDLTVIDYFHYDEDYHFDLLTNEDGKSLERIDFESPQNDPAFWRTASELVQWGTPGYENSQLFQANVVGAASVDPKIFSPDNDGYQDVVTINLQLNQNENVVDVEIFDHQGRLIRRLADNVFTGNEASFVWDGIGDNGEKASVGSYVILVSVVDDNGNQEQYKLVVALATQF